MMSVVSRASDTNGRVEHPEDGSSVLANLPRTRPQRATARRTAARSPGPSSSEPSDAPSLPEPSDAAASDVAATSAAKLASRGPRSRAAKAPASGTKRASKPRTRSARPRPVAEEVPRQGFESEEERATGSVAPPSGIELLGTAAEALGEIAKAGLSGGERLLKDVLSRLPR
jgi:hypothetical protein